MIIPVKLGKNSYDIIIQKGSLSKAGEFFDLKRKVLIVTDEGVPIEYSKAVAAQCSYSVTEILPGGESSKSLENFERLCRLMLQNDFSRDDCVVAVGGGVVGDIAGFAASCYMRGIDFYNIPTTLLSQVDSSVGGKTAVDLCGIKNIVGTFYQPKGVIIDWDVLKTLEQRQFACGAAEIIKMAAAFDEEFFEIIEFCNIKDNLEMAIAGSLKIKAKVVEEDEKEKGLRKVLNFGHTIGHGIESASSLLHGECVAIGMLPMCSEEVRKRIEPLLIREGLAVSLAEAVRNGRSSVYDREEQIFAVTEAVMHDKKAGGGVITAVKVDEIGKFRFEKMDREQIGSAILEVL